MAGDWIKMRADLHTHPKVVRISSALNADRLRTVGGLHAVWCLFDAHSEDGQLDGYTPEALDDLIGWPGFSRALAAVGWLEIHAESLELPRFDTHNGQSAKRRAQETDRKRESRKVSASDADKKRTREEKRREDKKTMSGTPDPDSPAGLIEYLNDRTGKAFRPAKANVALLQARLKDATPDEVRAVIDAKADQWGADAKMAEYLRPATLFAATNFEQYLGAIGTEPAQANSPWAGAI